jgi:hypothetical protein
MVEEQAYWKNLNKVLPKATSSEVILYKYY